jgi:hypothetical protein
MKTQILAFAVVAALSGVQTVNASINGGYIVLSTNNGAVQYGDGGEFQATVYGSLADAQSGVNNVGTFYTFCADTTKYVYPGNIYHVADAGVPQHTSGPGTTEMSQFGQWLFYEYWSNGNKDAPASLAGYVPGHQALSNTNNSFGSLSNLEVAGAIQEEIWASLGITSFPFADLRATAESIFGWNPDAIGQSFGSVDMLTLTPLTSGGVDDPGQPQLYVPDVAPGNVSNVVPEPATIIIWSLLGTVAITIGWWRRRKAV